MNYDNFLLSTKAEIKSRVPEDWEVEIRPFPKNNGVIYDGLVISRPGLNISPTIYLNPYFHRYLDGVEMEDIYSDILLTYDRFVPSEPFDIDRLLDFEQVKDRIVMKIINLKSNIDYLDDKPYIAYLDFAIIFQIFVSEDSLGYSCSTISQELVKRWDVSLEKIYSLAKENTPRHFPSRINDLESFLELSPELLEKYQIRNPEPPIYVLTNNTKVNGATCILYPEIFEEIANKHNSNLILIPSSIHEFLILPYTEDLSIDYCNFMVNEINDIEVPDSDVLSDHVYVYDRDLGQIIIP